jgi:hypothetical protein
VKGKSKISCLFTSLFSWRNTSIARGFQADFQEAFQEEFQVLVHSHDALSRVKTIRNINGKEYKKGKHTEQQNKNTQTKLRKI